MVQYTVLKNRLTSSGLAPYLAKTLQDGSVSYDQFIKALAYGSTATAADVKAVMDNLERVCIENLAQGRSVNLGFCTMRLMVKGSFPNREASFSAENNWIEISYASNPTFQKKVTAEAKIQRVSQNKRIPLLLSVENHTSGLETSIGAGDLLSLHGENMKFDKTSANIGVFFETAGVEQRVSEYSQVSGKVICFKVPSGLQLGESYKLKLKSIFGQEIRTGELDYQLNAA